MKTYFELPINITFVFLKSFLNSCLLDTLFCTNFREKNLLTFEDFTYLVKYL